MENINQEKIKANLQKVKQEINDALIRSGREGEKVTLVVVTKTGPPELNKILYDLGVRHFGENRVDAGTDKLRGLRELEGVIWHMIGNLQSRGAKRMADHFNVFHGLDRIKIARKLNGFQHSAKIDTFLQFNVTGEETKSGWKADQEESWEELVPDIKEILSFSNLNIQGLMMMAPFEAEPEMLRKYFRKLKKLQQFLIEKVPQGKWHHLSMGMSNDFVLAVEEGATIVRVGSAIVS